MLINLIHAVEGTETGRLARVLETKWSKADAPGRPGYRPPNELYEAFMLQIQKYLVDQFDADNRHAAHSNVRLVLAAVELL